MIQLFKGLNGYPAGRLPVAPGDGPRRRGRRASSDRCACGPSSSAAATGSRQTAQRGFRTSVGAGGSPGPAAPRAGRSGRSPHLPVHRSLRAIQAPHHEALADRLQAPERRVEPVRHRSVSRVRPLGEVVSAFRLCWFTVIVLAIRSTSSRQRSALISPTRRPASPASQTATYHVGLSTCAAGRRRVLREVPGEDLGPLHLEQANLGCGCDHLALGRVLQRLRPSLASVEGQVVEPRSEIPHT